MNEKIIEFISNNQNHFISSQNTSFMNAYQVFDIDNKKIFIKRINKEKIKEVFQDDYIKTWDIYYNTIKQYFDSVKTYGIYEIDNNIYETYKYLEKDKFLSYGNNFDFEDLISTIKKIYNSINNLLESAHAGSMGIETVIWNFTIDGILFDFSPPRYLKNKTASIFTRVGDSDHYQRTYYRNYTSLGMKLSVINSVIAITSQKEIIVELPSNWKNILFDIFATSCNQKEYQEVINYLFNKTILKEEFSKHPLKILKKTFTNS